MSDWPTTIVFDRYSKGWIAWPFEYADVPRSPHSGDPEMIEFWWGDARDYCGIADTPAEALAELNEKRKGEGFADAARGWRDRQENHERREGIWD